MDSILTNIEISLNADEIRELMHKQSRKNS